jgi:lipoyl synthase
MSSNSRPPVIPSGSKFRNEQGVTAIKDGVKASAVNVQSTPVPRKPQWLRARMPGGERFEAVRQNVREHRLSTVCEESHCPNIGECWNNGTATIMVMGSVCTRALQVLRGGYRQPEGLAGRG